MEIRKCDVCGAEGAERWGIIRPDGEQVDIDLCGKDARPFARVAPARSVRTREQLRLRG